MKLIRTTERTAADQAASYLAKCVPAIQGQDGNGTTARLAKAVVMGFDLEPQVALGVFRQWNATCVPPWQEKELLRLLETVAKWPGERGNLLHKGNEIILPRPVAPVVEYKPSPPVERHPPSLEGFSAASQKDLQEILFYREIGGIEGLRWAASRGVLVTGRWRDWKCYGVTDASGRVLEVRRVDNEKFPKMGPLPERKSHSVKGSQKSWPLGLPEAKEFPAIALVEGLPDFLVAHQVILWEQASHYTKTDVSCAPVAMLSASPSIDPSALPLFAGKRVCIFAHAEKTGFKGATKWGEQLEPFAASVKIADFSDDRRADGTWPKDLDEWNRMGPFTSFKIMPV